MSAGQFFKVRSTTAKARMRLLAKQAATAVLERLPGYRELLAEARKSVAQKEAAVAEANKLRIDSEAVIAEAQEAVRRSAHPLSLAPGRQAYPSAAAVGKRAEARDRPVAATWTPTVEPAISVVLSTYNRINLLKETVNSVRKNGTKVPYEIIVVDGGSTDGSAEWLVQQADIISVVQHNRIDGERQRSWGWFTNLGFRAAHADIVLMISDDCLLVPGAVNAGLEALVSAEREGRRVGGVAFYYRDWPTEAAYGLQHTVGGMLMVNHGLFRRQALEEVGYCEERLFAFYKADSDLALKLWHSGYEIIESPHSLVEHLILPEEKLRIENNATMERDRQTLLERWEGRFNHRVFSEDFKKPFRKSRAFNDETDTVAAFRRFVPDRAV